MYPVIKNPIPLNEVDFCRREKEKLSGLQINRWSQT